MLTTTLFDWAIVELVAEDSPHQKRLFLWGLVSEDLLGRFQNGDYVFTSLITAIYPDSRQVITKTNHVYNLVGPGQRVKASGDELEMLRNGYSPGDIELIKS